MRRMLFFTARLKPPYAWRILGLRVGAMSASIGLGGFLALGALQPFGLQKIGLVIMVFCVAAMVAIAWWLTSMTPPLPGIALREGTQLGLLWKRIRTREWTNNRLWPSPIAARMGNIVFLKNGDVWVNYVAQGPNFSAHKQDTVKAAQQLNARLMSTLSKLGFIREFHDIGVKVRVPASTLTRRCIGHVPDWAKYEASLYSAAAEGLRHFNNQYTTGQRNSFERPHWLAMHIGSVDMKLYERLLDTAGLASTQAGIDTQEAQNRERQIFAALPPELHAAKTNPRDLDWMLKRAALRGLPGINVPTMPPRQFDPAMIPGNNNFQTVTITTGHEVDAVADIYAQRIAEQAGTKVRLLRRIFRDGIFRRYRSIRKETSIAVHVPGSRTTDLPDGYTTYQTFLTLASGPSVKGSYAIHKMAGIVDGFHELDADVSFRVTFTPLPGREAAKKLGKAQKRNNSDDSALSQSEFDAAEYAGKDAELRTLHGHASEENMLANVHITFAFADVNYQQLEHKVQKVIDAMAATEEDKDDGFQLVRHVGSQIELWQSMLPCTTATQLIDDTRLSQTPALLGAVMPLRRQTLGDPYGWPIGENLENSLGQVVFMDVVTPTIGGDGSILLYGEQGTGKSSFYKVIGSAVYDTGGTCWFTDPSGEMAVYASEFPGAIPVDLMEPKASLDLLKCLPADQAALAWLDTWCPLLGVEQNSDEYERLATVITPGYRAVHHSPFSSTPGLKTTRQVFDHIGQQNDAAAKHIRRSFNSIKGMPGAAVLLDPVDDHGQVVDLPAFNGAESRFVVFVSRQYQLHEGDTATETSTRLGTAAFTAIAALANFYFPRRDGVKLFGLDEAHAHDAAIVHRNILSDTNMKGRKFKTIVMISTPTKQSLSKGLEAVTRRGGFRQRATANAVPVLEDLHMVPTPLAVQLMSSDLSPIDPTTREVQEGREGELLWFDGLNVGKMRTFLPFIPGRARLADTRPDQLIRLDEHNASQKSRHHVD